MSKKNKKIEIEDEERKLQEETTMEEENTSDVLRRHYGKVGSHDRVYGFCYNPI